MREGEATIIQDAPEGAEEGGWPEVDGQQKNFRESLREQYSGLVEKWTDELKNMSDEEIREMIVDRKITEMLQKQKRGMGDLIVKESAHSEDAPERADEGGWPEAGGQQKDFRESLKEQYSGIAKKWTDELAGMSDEELKIIVIDTRIADMLQKQEKGR